MLKNCLICHKEFKPTSNSLGKYCSVQCTGKSNIGNTKGFKKFHTPWNKDSHIRTNTGRTHIKKGQHISPTTEWKKEPILTKICEKCGKVFEKPYRFNIGRWVNSRFCSLECSSQGNSNWKGGITPINTKIRNSPVFVKWAKDIKERDEYKCQICGEVGSKLHANHIKKFSDYPDLRFELSNGITLCEYCHIQLVTYSEPEWESYFNFNLMNRGYLWPR